MDVIGYIAAFIFVIALIGAGAWLLRHFLLDGKATPARRFFAPREKRMGVVQTASVDGRRRLVLIRRDDKEHLIMTGGPVDMVIETGIEPPEITTPSFPERRAPLFERTKPRLQEEAVELEAEEEDDDEPVLVARGRERSVRTE